MNLNDAHVGKFRELVLEKIKYRASVPMPGELWNDPEAIDIVADMFVDQAYGMIEWRIPGKRYVSRAVIVPDGWWQAFKLEVFPAWLSQRFPPRMRRIETEVIKVAPQLELPKDMGRLYNFFVPEDDERAK